MASYVIVGVALLLAVLVNLAVLKWYHLTGVSNQHVVLGSIEAAADESFDMELRTAA
jgi:hypothetical protein